MPRSLPRPPPAELLAQTAAGLLNMHTATAQSEYLENAGGIFAVYAVKHDVADDGRMVSAGRRTSGATKAGR